MIKNHRIQISIACATAVFIALLATPAYAATEIGSHCSATSSPPNTTVVSVASAPGAESFEIPAGGGIITQWGELLPSIGSTVVPTKLKVFRPTASPTSYLVTGESGVEGIVSGLNVFSAHVPVTAGDRIGTNSSLAVLLCGASVAGDTAALASSPADVAPGQTITVGAPSAGRPTLFATIEADADKDGFGDETQDLCPLSASFQIACPTVKLAKRVLTPTKSGVELLITSNTSAPVTVSGTVSIKAAKAKKSSTAASFKVGPVTKTVNPGDLVSFKLKYSKKLAKALKAYSSSKKFKLKLTVTGKGITGSDTTVVNATIRGTKN